MCLCICACMCVSFTISLFLWGKNCVFIAQTVLYIYTEVMPLSGPLVHFDSLISITPCPHNVTSN